GCGSPSPSTVMTPSRNRMANGKPNRKRTCVAPTVPSVAVSSRCMALRAVCAPAAMIVKTAQSMSLRAVALADHIQARILDRRFELARRHELVPLMRAARQPAQHIFGADDGERETLERAVERRRDHQ